jgi:hypothetical protein
MKVICVGNDFLPEYEQYYRDDHYGVTIGKHYTVLSVETKWVGPQLNNMEYFYVLLGDKKEARFCPASLFQVEDSSIPSSWVIDLNAEANMIRLGPRQWLTGSFWEDYSDGHTEAISAFVKAAEELLAEDNSFKPRRNEETARITDSR